MESVDILKTYVLCPGVDIQEVLIDGCYAGEQYLVDKYFFKKNPEAILDVPKKHIGVVFAYIPEPLRTDLKNIYEKPTLTSKLQSAAEKAAEHNKNNPASPEIEKKTEMTK